MQKKNSAIVYLATFLVVIGVIVSSCVAVEYASVISTVTTTVTAIIGAVALYIQFKKDKEVNQQSFIIEFGKQFYESYNCEHIYKMLDDIGRGKPFYYSDDVAFEVVKALEWCEALAGMIKDGVVSYASVDGLCSYRFFIITNNKEIQDNELLPFCDYYPGVLAVHEKWTEYKRKHNLPIVFDETNLTDRIKKEGHNIPTHTLEQNDEENGKSINKDTNIIQPSSKKELDSKTKSKTSLNRQTLNSSKKVSELKTQNIKSRKKSN